MGSHSKKAVSSTVILVIGQAYYNGALALEVLLLTRWLIGERLGVYFYALSLASLLEVFVHWGAQHFVNREAAVRFDVGARELLPGLLRSAAFSTVIITASLALLFGWPLALIAAAGLIRAAAGMLSAIFIGRSDIWPPVIGRVASQSVLLLGLWLFVRQRPDLIVLSAVLVAAAALYAAVQLVSLRRIQLTIGTSSGSSGSATGAVARRILPFVLLFALGQLYYRADAVIIKWLAGVEAVSVQMLAFKWVEGFFFAPAVVAAAAIPVLLQAGDGVVRALRTYAVALGGGLSVASLALLFIGEPVLVIALGSSFEPSVPLFRMLVWALPLQGLGFFFAAALVAFEREAALLLLTAIIAPLGVALRVTGLEADGLRGFSVAVLATLAAYTACTGALLLRHMVRGDRMEPSRSGSPR